MPPIKIERIVSFSSEDPIYVAANLLKDDTNKKWKCKTPGEINVTIVFQLEQPYIISSIDIGNEHSAYIEILVSRSTTPEEFKPFLIMTSFMTSLEARQSQNVRKVKMFKYEDFFEEARNEKWDRIKVVCTQPFNRHVQYGLSFIKFNSSDAGKHVAEQTNKKFSLGKFQIRPESPDSFSKGSLFASIKPIEPLKGAVAIRAASSESNTASSSNHSYSAVSSKETIKQMLFLKQKEKRTSTATITSGSSEEKDDVSQSSKRYRNELLYDKNGDETENTKIDKLLTLMESEKKKKLEDTAISTPKKKQQPVTKTSSSSSSPNINNKVGEKRKYSLSNNDDSGFKEKKSKGTTKIMQRKPFNQLLDGVTFVISGIQNPDRSKIRSMALSMGAKYRGDWDNSCTHLICAFINTPKFRQVKGKGKIVNKNWLEDCCKQRKRLPWRRYALDKSDKACRESEEEIWEENKQEKMKNANASKQAIHESDNDSDLDTREAGSDTEERIKHIKKQQPQSQPETKTTKQYDIYEADTEDDDDVDESQINQIHTFTNNLLANFYSPYTFYIDKDVFDTNLVQELKTYITAYDGTLAQELNKSVDYIITNDNNSELFRNSHPTILCVRCDWIWKCHNKKTVCPIAPYIL